MARVAQPRAVVGPTVPYERRDERHLGGAAVAFLSAVAVPVCAVAYLLAGPGGALGAAVGVGLVAILFGLSGLLLAWGARHGLPAWTGAVWGGLALRVVIYLAVLAAAAQVEALHRESLAIATAVAFVLALGYEMRLVSRRRELFFVDAGAGRPRGDAVPPEGAEA